MPTSQARALSGTRAPRAGRVELTPPGLCAGPRPRPARGARAPLVGVGCLRRLPKGVPGGYKPSPWGEPLGWRCPPSPCAGRRRDPRHGRRHPWPSPGRSGSSPRPGPARRLCWLRPVGPLRIQRGGGPGRDWRPERGRCVRISCRQGRVSGSKAPKSSAEERGRPSRTGRPL